MCSNEDPLHSAHCGKSLEALDSVRGKRGASVVAGLALAVALCVLFAWPSLRDAWYVHRLRTEESLLKQAILDPTLCPASAVERYVRTDQGRAALSELLALLSKQIAEGQQRLAALRKLTVQLQKERAQLLAECEEFRKELAKGLPADEAEKTKQRIAAIEAQLAKNAKLLKSLK